MVYSFGSHEVPGGWKRQENPAALFEHDMVLRSSLEKSKACMMCRSSEGFQLAFPFDSRNPMAMLPIFCLGKVRHLGDGYYIVYAFDAQGRPKL